MMPKDENEGRHMVNTALSYEEGPIAMRFPRGNGLGVKMDKELKTIPIGTWEVLRPGKDAVILTFGTTIEMALEAAEELQKEGLSVRVVNARFIKPIDKQMMKAILNEGLPILTIEEAVLEGGFGSTILEYAHDLGMYHTPIDRMGIPDRFIEHGSVTALLEEIGLTKAEVMNRIKLLMPPKTHKGIGS